MNKFKKNNFTSVKLPTVVWLIIINVVVSVSALIALYFSESYFELLALKPANIANGIYLWTLLTHMFVHAGLFHLFVNMFSLYFVGSLTEKIIGKKRFVWSYILTGLFAAVLTVVLSVAFGNSNLGAKIFGSPEIYMVGASGAIFGILGILTVLLPRLKVYLISGPIVVIIIQAVADKLFPNASGGIDLVATFVIVIMLVSMFSLNRKSKIALPLEIPLWSIPIFAIVPLIAISFFIQLPIGNIAHLGGFIAGIIYGTYLRTKYKKKVKRLQAIFR